MVAARPGTPDDPNSVPPEASGRERAELQAAHAQTESILVDRDEKALQRSGRRFATTCPSTGRTPSGSEISGSGPRRRGRCTQFVTTVLELANPLRKPPEDGDHSGRNCISPSVCCRKTPRPRRGVRRSHPSPPQQLVAFFTCFRRACGDIQHAATCSRERTPWSVSGSWNGDGGTVSGYSPTRAASRAIRPRFAPAAAPTIVVMTAMSPGCCVDPSSALTRAAAGSALSTGAFGERRALVVRPRAAGHR